MSKVNMKCHMVDQNLHMNYSGYPLEVLDLDEIRNAFLGKETLKFPVCNSMVIKIYLKEIKLRSESKTHKIHQIYKDFKHTNYPLKHFNVEDIIKVLEDNSLTRYVKNHNYFLKIDAVYETDEEGNVASEDDFDGDTKSSPVFEFDNIIKASVEAMDAIKEIESVDEFASYKVFSVTSEENIYKIRDILELAEKFKDFDPNKKIIFVDSDLNQYYIQKKFKYEVIGEALNLDKETMEEYDANYDEECIVIGVL